MLRRIIVVICLALPLLGAAAQQPGEADAGIAVRVHAREIAPGELLRVEVVTARPLQTLTGELLDQPVHMVRTLAEPAATRWSGWTMIDLDREPGPATLELSGILEDGSRIDRDLQLTVEPRAFPEEHLQVSSRYVEPPAEVTQRLTRERKKLANLYESRRDNAPPSRPFQAPVTGEPTSIFGTRRLYNGKPRSPHPGLDLRAATGTPVEAPGPGLVVLAEELYYSGHTVILDHGGGLFTLYAHLSRLGVKVGESVEPGQQLGLSGATGRVTGPHLHWGAKIGNRPFDPRALLDRALFAP